jgi:hypothetical protein
MGLATGYVLQSCYGEKRLLVQKALHNNLSSVVSEEGVIQVNHFHGSQNKNPAQHIKPVISQEDTHKTADFKEIRIQASLT